MNKKVVLSVLSATFVASVASSAFAAPKDGLYIGGNVDKYYSIETLFGLTAEGKAQFGQELAGTDFNNLVFVDFDGKGASIQEILDNGLDKAKQDPLVADDFEASYSIAKADGTVDGTYDARKDVDGVTPGELKVESVSAINLNQIKVVFSQEVDETSAENEANYTISGLSTSAVAEATLLEDGKTVILTLSAAQRQSSTAAIQVANVLSKDSKVVPTKIDNVTFADVTAPTITSVKAIGNKTVVVTLSEPVAGLQATDFKLNGNALSIYGGASVQASDGANDDQPDNQQYTLTFNNALQPGTYNLEFTASTARLDAAGFPLAKVTKSFTVDGVTTAPVATVSAAKSGVNGTVTVTFDREMDATTLTTANFELNTAGNAATGRTISPDNKSVTLTFSNVPAGANVLLINPAVEDTFGNNVTTSTNPVRVSFTASADTVAPQLLTATSADDTHVTLTFDEALDSLTSNNSANYVIKDAAGNKVAPTTTRSLSPSLVTSGSLANKQVQITLGSYLNGGTYTIEVTGIKDTSGNAMGTVSKTFTVNDQRAPEFVDKDANTTGVQAAVYNSSTHEVEVFFNEAMQVDGPYSILDKNNWRLNGNAVPAHVSITPGADNKSAVLHFVATDGINPGTTTLTLLTGKDVAGNVFATATTGIVGAANVDNPVILDGTVEAKPGTSSNDVLTFEVDQDLVNLAADDFLVEVNGSPVTVTGATYSNKVVTLTFANGDLGDGTGVTLDVTGTIETTNAAGATLDTETGSALTAEDKIGPTVVGAEVTGARTIEITFNEDLDASLSGLFKSDWVIDNAGATVAVQSSSANGAVLTLTVPTTVTLASSNVKVYPASTVTQTKDANGNLFVPTSTQLSSGIPAVDGIAPAITSVTADNTVYANGDTITLTVDAGEAGLTVTADFSNIDSEYAAGDETVVDNGDGTYTITYTIDAANTTPDGTGLAIDVTVEDAANNTDTYTVNVDLDNTP